LQGGDGGSVLSDGLLTLRSGGLCLFGSGLSLGGSILGLLQLRILGGQVVLEAIDLPFEFLLQGLNLVRDGGRRRRFLLFWLLDASSPGARSPRRVRMRQPGCCQHRCGGNN